MKTKPMKPRIKKLWIEALRSGEYQQAQGVLRDKDNKFCCLGVLCNIHAQKNKAKARTQTDPNFYFGKDDVLPVEVADWAGLKAVNPQIEDYGTYHGGYSPSLGELNDGLFDGRIRTFNEIADIIEKHL
jgi:hypothetical protein